MYEIEEMNAARRAAERMTAALSAGGQAARLLARQSTSLAGGLLNAAAWKSGSKAMENTAAALNKVAKSTRSVLAAQRDLYGFDRITRVSARSSASGSSSRSGSGRSSGSGSGTDTEPGTSIFQRIVEQAAAAAKQVKEATDKIWEPIKTLGAKEISFHNMVSAFQSVKTAAQPVVNQMNGGLKEGFVSVLQPLAKWVLPAAGSTSMSVMTGALGMLASGLNGVRPFGKTVWEGLLVPMGKWTGSVLLSGLGNVSTAFGGLSGVLSGLPAGWDVLKNRAGAAWSGIKASMVGAAVGGSSGVLTALSGLSTDANTSGEMLRKNLATLCEKIVKNTKSGLSGVSGALKTPFKNGLNGVVELVNKVIGKINSSMKLSWPVVKVAGKVVAAAGKVTLATLPAVSKLAEGGIATGPTFSLIGEAGREAVLPLERNTDWMDRLAERIAGRMGQSGETVVEVNIGGEQLTRQVVRGVNDLTRRTGRCPIYI